MKHYLTGKEIILKPATVQDREKIFLWLTNSNLTKDMMGPPNYPDSKIPSWEEFKNDFAEYYFDGSQPMNGQCFIIQVEGEDIGQINHNVIDNKNKVTDLDIWLSDLKYTGKGIGTEAIKLICEYLEKKYGCRQIKISPSKRNKKAIGAYIKAGFVMTDIVPDKSEMDYKDNVVLIKKIK